MTIDARPERRVTRRDFLRMSGLVSSALALGPILGPKKQESPGVGSEFEGVHINPGQYCHYRVNFISTPDPHVVGEWRAVYRNRVFNGAVVEAYWLHNFVNDVYWELRATEVVPITPDSLSETDVWPQMRYDPETDQVYAISNYPNGQKTRIYDTFGPLVVADAGQEKLA